MKNLIFSAVGDTSLHKNWISNKPDFDLFLVYYGDMGDRYSKDAPYYDRAKGTKFHILASMLEKYPYLFQSYDAICVPDDDLLINATDWNRFFQYFHQYNLLVAQPSIIGWVSIPITTPQIDTILRYVPYIEIMTPCFSKKALEICQNTFTENRTNWGIEWLWFQKLNEPKDKFAIIDDVTAIHTRPCFFGDTYWRNQNNYDLAMQEITNLLKKYNINAEYKVFGSIPRNLNAWHDKPSEQKFFPFNSLLTTMFASKASENINL